MLRHIIAAWKNNHGWPLLAVGGVAGCIMCLLWYQQWIPHINFVAANSLSSSPVVVLPKSYFVARIEVVPPLEAGQELKGILQIFTQDGSRSPLDSERFPFLRRSFVIDSAAAVTIVEELLPGEYAAFAFLDLNDNDLFDVNSAGVPLEPFDTSSRRKPVTDWSDLSSADFRAEVGTTVFRELSLQAPAD